MAVLLIRIEGPLQSWGTQSKFTNRDTGYEPSKSGIVGLICSAMGRPRTESVDDLADCKMAVRADREGILKRDFHTARQIYKAGGGIKEAAELSNRFYLADAIFLVGLESESKGLLKSVSDSLCSPVWQLFLGRKSFTPSSTVYMQDGFFETGCLIDCMKTYPWLGSDSGKKPTHLRCVMENDFPEAVDARFDQPVGAAFLDRTFGMRYVSTLFLEIP